MLAPSVVLLGRLVSSRQVMIVAAVVALGTVVVGGGNAIEDGFGVQIGGTPYVVGFLMAWISLLGLAVAFHRARYPRLAGLSVVLFVGVMLFTVGGGLIVLGGLGAVAIAPVWFARPAPAISVFADSGSV